MLERPLGPWQQAFHIANRAAFDDMMNSHPVRRDLVRRAWRPRRGDQPGWMADFLGIVPAARGMSFDDELAQLAGEWDDQRIRSELHSVRPGRLATTLLAPGLRTHLLELLRWVWTVTVAADWPRRRRVLQADVVSRTTMLAAHGWSGVIPTLGAKRRWLGDGRLQINRYDLPDRDLSGAQTLLFIPTHSNGSWVAWHEPTRYAIVYPVTGVLAPTTAPNTQGLARLIGANRALLLHTLDDPRSTTQLAAISGLPIGAVGNHLKVMLDAGLVLRRRAGREVLYWRTALGDSLIATTHQPAGSARTERPVNPAAEPHRPTTTTQPAPSDRTTTVRAAEAPPAAKATDTADLRPGGFIPTSGMISSAHIGPSVRGALGIGVTPRDCPPQAGAHARRQIRAGRYRTGLWILRNACGTS